MSAMDAVSPKIRRICQLGPIHHSLNTKIVLMDRKAGGSTDKNGKPHNLIMSQIDAVLLENLEVIRLVHARYWYQKG